MIENGRASAAARAKRGDPDQLAADPAGSLCN
jgi:hypothetical protein